MGARRWVPVVALVSGVALVASSCRLTNPGTFTMTMSPASNFHAHHTDGSTIVINDQPLFQPVVASCADGIDDDGDGVTDFPADPGCASADDNNERVDGAQPFVAAQVPFVANGSVITVDTGLLTSPAYERCIAAVSFCFTLQLVGIPGVHTAVIGASGHSEVPFPVALAISGPGLPDGCIVGPVDGPAVLEGYDGLGGRATIAMRDLTIPPVTTCGGDWDYFLSLLVSGGDNRFDLILDGPVLDGGGRPMQFG